MIYKSDRSKALDAALERIIDYCADYMEAWLELMQMLHKDGVIKGGKQPRRARRTTKRASRKHPSPHTPKGS